MAKTFRKVLAAALAALIFITTGCSSAETGTTSTGSVLAQPSYPEMSPYPNEQEFFQENGEFDGDGFDKVYTAWREDQLAQQNQPLGYADGLEDFFLQSIPVFLSDAKGDNAVCSPLNIYMALALLAETTGGNSRQQILDVLGSDSAAALREQAGQVWNAHYCADGATSTLLANSLWLNSGVTYRAETVNTLAENYYASVYQGDLGSEEMNQALRDWVNAQTDGLLEDQPQNLEMDAETILALASTICYRAKWRDEFWEDNNTQGLFHAPEGDTSVTFMNRTLAYGPYFWGEDFAAACLTLEDSSKMWLILPDEGKTPQDILSSGYALDMVLNHSDSYENRRQLQVHLSLPKFDVAADVPLEEALQSLGITDVFSEAKADFTPILPEDGAWLNSVQHAARVAIDEEGVTAAAYTVMMYCGASIPPEDEVYLTLDRPFLFVITSRDDLPLFAGVVNVP